MQHDIGSMSEAMVLLDGYIAAYEDLLVEHARLMRRYISTREDLAHARAAIANDLWLIEQLARPIESESPF